MEKTNKKSPLLTLVLSAAALFVVFYLLKACTNGISDSKVSRPTLDMNQLSYATLYDTKDFATYPANYKNKKIAIKCEVFNIVDTSQFQCWTIENREAIGVLTDSTYSGLYEDDVITVYGIGGGEYCGKNAFGAKVCAPLIERAWWTKP